MFISQYASSTFRKIEKKERRLFPFWLPSKKNMCVFFWRNRDFPTSRGILAMEDLPGVLIIGSFQSPFHGIQLLITRPRAEAEAINQDLEIFDMERYER